MCSICSHRCTKPRSGFRRCTDSLAAQLLNKPQLYIYVLENGPVPIETVNHVAGIERYQERTAPDQKYDYESTYFDSDSPVDLLWDVLRRIEERVSDRQ